MKRELKLMKNTIEWVNPRMGHEISRLLNHEREPVRMILSGCACILYSSFTKTEIEWMQKNHPEALYETDEEGTNNFTISFSEESPGSITEDGIDFGSKVSPDGFPQATIIIEPSVEDGLALISEALGKPLIRLAEMESRMLALFQRDSDRERRIRRRIICI